MHFSNGFLHISTIIVPPGAMQMLVTKSFSSQETYPRSAPIWFTESEEASISEILERLSECAPHNYNVTYSFIFICYEMSRRST